MIVDNSNKIISNFLDLNKHPIKGVNTKIKGVNTKIKGVTTKIKGIN